MNRTRSIVAGLLVIAAVTGLATALYIGGAEAPAQRPDFTLPDLQGQPRTAAEFDGKVLIINFWATWCKPCRKEIPMLVAAQNDYGPRGVQVIGVAVDTRGAATAFADRYDINYPVLAAPTEGARVQDAYTTGDGPAGVLPYTVIVDRDGRMIEHIAGALDRARLDPLITPLLAPKSASQATK